MAKTGTDPGLGAQVEPPSPEEGEPLPTARFRTNPDAGVVPDGHDLLRRVKPVQKGGIRKLHDTLADAQRENVRIVEREAALQEIKRETPAERPNPSSREEATVPVRAVPLEKNRTALAVVLLVLVLAGVAAVIARYTGGTTVQPPTAPTAPRVQASQAPAWIPPPEPTATPSVAPATTAATSAAPTAATSAAKTAPHQGAIGPATGNPVPSAVPVPAPPPSATPSAKPSATQANNPDVPPY